MNGLKVFGYARVSTKEQKLEVQIDKIKKYCDLKDFELINIFEDKASGKNMERGGFLKMIEILKNNTLGVNGVVIVKLDRIGRSVMDLVHIMKFFEENNIHISSIDDNIDTSTKEGRLFFHFTAAFAEYERELIIDRTSTGKAFARDMGVKFGRKEKKFNAKEIKKDIALGIPKTLIAKKYNMAESTLYRKLNNYNIELERNVDEYKEKYDDEKINPL
jgi:DNA invertase Pin-like site-specific DNA recombinase